MLIDAQATSRIEYAIYSTTAYATALELCRCIAPLAAPTDVDGASGIRSIVIARAGKLKSVSDLPKMKVAVPAEDDLSGWLTPLSLLAHGGLVLRGDEPFIVTSPTALEAEAQFANGKNRCDLGLGARYARW
jgi:phosphonate transport system substrate-binding protein